MKRSLEWITSIMILSLLTIGGIFVPNGAQMVEVVKAAVIPLTTSLQLGNRQTGSVTVVGIGGSSALGWGDVKGGGGYLTRAFRAVNQSGSPKYNFVNASIEGDGPVQYAHILPWILKTNHPSVVVMSFGLLDDAANKTNVHAFQRGLQSDIAESLQTGASVVIVTPPPVIATVPIGPNVQRYFQAERDVAKLYKGNNRVHVIDLHAQMVHYMQVHHKSVTSIAADNWHLNQAGHTLAGGILSRDFEAVYPSPHRHTVAGRGRVHRDKQKRYGVN